MASGPAGQRVSWPELIVAKVIMATANGKEETLPPWARCIVKVHFDDEHGEKYFEVDRKYDTIVSECSTIYDTRR